MNTFIPEDMVRFAAKLLYYGRYDRVSLWTTVHVSEFDVWAEGRHNEFGPWYIAIVVTDAFVTCCPSALRSTLGEIESFVEAGPMKKGFGQRVSTSEIHRPTN